MLFYTPHITPRITYIVQHLFGNQVQITNNIQVVQTSHQPFINYSTQSTGNAYEYWFFSNELLWQNNINNQLIVECFEKNNTPYFFKTTKGCWHFDVFSAIFYLLSRYEEYVVKNKDEHGRFCHTQSLAFKNNFLDIPIIEVWIDELQKAYELLPFAKTNFKTTISFDVDEAYKYKYHSKLKLFLSMAKCLLLFNFNDAINNVKALFQFNIEDEYDLFDDYINFTQQYKGNYEVKFFLLQHTKRWLHDKNLNANNKELQQLYKKLAQQFKVGIHPSYASGQLQMKANDSLLKQQIALLNATISSAITLSRQHYLLVQMPNTYNTLCQQNILQDYSMGYGKFNGFRAGTCRSFLWFNLEANKATSLLIHPFFYMDSTAIHYLKLSSHQAFEQLCHYLQLVKKYNGHFIAVFHNHFMALNKKGKPWLALYKKFLQYLQLHS